MLGDNRHDSNDSRYWGFVPERYIIVKVVLVLFSNGKMDSDGTDSSKLLYRND
jgi:signal peptidase I